MVKPRTKKQPNPLSNISYVDFLALAGVLFVGASIVTYITNYWDVLPRGAYLFLFLVLTALPYAASAWAVLAQKEGLSDILLFVGGVVVAGALVFIMFAYNFNPQITYYIIPLLYLAMLLPALITGQRTFLFWAALVIPLWTLGPSAQLTGSELLVHLLILVSMASSRLPHSPCGKTGPLVCTWDSFSPFYVSPLCSEVRHTSPERKSLFW